MRLGSVRLILAGWSPPGNTGGRAHGGCLPVPFTQPFAAYLDALHSQSALSRDRMAPEAVAAFDAEVRTLVTPHLVAGAVRLQAAAQVTWGRPLAP